MAVMTSRPMRSIAGVALSVLGMLLVGGVFANSAHATTYTVSNTSSSGVGSLRQAILDANSATPGTDDTITFIPGLSGTISTGGSQLDIRDGLTIQGPGAKVLAVSGGSTGRVFYVAPGVTAEISGLTIRDGLVTGTAGSTGSNPGGTGGQGGDASGGGILNDGGLLTMRGVAVVGNSAVGGQGGAGGVGSAGSTGSTFGAGGNGGQGGQGGQGGTAWAGGILNKGALTLQDSTVTGNTTRGGDGGTGGNGGLGGTGNLNAGGNGGTGGLGGVAGAGRGGGLYNDGTRLTVINSTVDGNVASGGNGGRGGNGGMGGSGIVMGSGGNGGMGGNGGNGNGGGIYRNSGTVGLTNATVSANGANGGFPGLGGPGGTGSVIGSTGANGASGAGQGGGLYSSATLGNTIVALNSATSSPDVAGAFTSQGNNLIGDTNGGSGFTLSDKPNINPQLGPLADNGGQTMTRALLTGSPAINQGNTALAPTMDQRGVVRPQGAAADIGAFEVDVAPSVIRATPTGRRVSLKANVVAVFSEPMNASTLRTLTGGSSTFILKKGTTKVAAKVSVDATGEVATLNPTRNLKAGASYTAMVTTGAQDQWGTALDQNSSTTGNQSKSWTFRVKR